MGQMIFTVDKICGYIKNIFESESLLQNISISGEVSGYGESGGNAYFVLKGKESQINCVYFATDIRKYLPRNGDNCILNGSVTYYKKGGKISFYVTNIMPYGQGLSYLKFLELKDKLEKEGVFSEIHKKPLPEFIQKIAVVTSKSGAVIHDIIKIATKKFPSADIILYSVKVQGEGAEKDIAEGIKITDNYGADVIIVARGGGSAEDLSPFNTEIVARAVYNSKTPIISAVGHETDYTLCDLAADKRAATPTESAEIALEGSLRLTSEIQDKLSSINMTVSAKYNSAYNHINLHIKNIFDKISGLTDLYTTDLKYTAKSIYEKAQSLYKDYFNCIFNITEKINAQSPLKLLQKGYAVVTDTNKKAVKSIKDLNNGQQIYITLIDGEAAAEIKNIKERLK